MNESTKILNNFLLNNSNLILNRKLLLSLGTTKSIFLTTLLEISASSISTKNDYNGYILNQPELINSLTGISLRLQIRLIGKFRDLKIIRTKRIGRPPRLYFRINGKKVFRLINEGISYSTINVFPRPNTTHPTKGRGSVWYGEIEKGGKEEEGKGFEFSSNNLEYLNLAKQLSKIVCSTKNIKINKLKLKAWSNEIKKLVTIEGIKIPRISKVLDWYSKNIGGEYIPVVESGLSLRNK